LYWKARIDEEHGAPVLGYHSTLEGRHYDNALSRISDGGQEAESNAEKQGRVIASWAVLPSEQELLSTHCGKGHV
jgi:hypothetical protein